MYLRRFVGLVLLVTGIAAHADTFNYSFTNTAFNTVTFFTYQSAALINTTTSFVPLTCGGFSFTSCSSVTLTVKGNPVPLSNAFEIDLGTPGPNSRGLLGDLSDDFFTVGTHTYGFASITISDIPSGSTVTPEPSSLLLLGTGALGVLGLARRKYLGA